MAAHTAAFGLMTALVFWSCAAQAHMAVKSAVPLWSGGDGAVWPRPIDGENQIGYGSPFSLGLWKKIEFDCEDCVDWMEIEIASVFHGGFSVASAGEREGLRYTARPALIIDLGKTADGRARLFAIQMGMQGSDYMLVTSRETQPPIKSLDIHGTTCEGRGWLSGLLRGFRERKAKSVSYWKTAYCEVRSQAGLRRLALRAAASPAIGTMTYVGAMPDEK